MSENSRTNNSPQYNNNIFRYALGVILAVGVILIDHLLSIVAMAQDVGYIFINPKAGILLPVVGVVFLAVSIVLLRVRYSIGVGLVVGGAISNIVDFVIYKGVLDYWYIAGVWFNVADIGIIVGLGWWLRHFLMTDLSLRDNKN